MSSSAPGDDARFVPHARAVLDALPRASASVPAGRLARRFGAYCRRVGDYANAAALLKLAVDIFGRSKGAQLERSEAMAELRSLQLFLETSATLDEPSRSSAR